MMETKIQRNSRVGEIVAHDFRTAEIFNKVGIDFCCGGAQLLEDACRSRGLNTEEIKKNIEEVMTSPEQTFHDFQSWDPVFLSDYIVNIHHRFVRTNVPELLNYTRKIASVHGAVHPELHQVATLFEDLSEELLQHLNKEEKILFPAIKEAYSNSQGKAGGLIASAISVMNNEHEQAGTAMDEIRRLTNSYSVPNDACNTYRVALKLLAQFENDLHVHVHLENNILFPKALQIATKITHS